MKPAPPESAGRAPPALALRGITVRYGAIIADRDVTLEVARGSIHAVVGENGAGKSTLMKAAFGLAPLAAGEVWLDGERVARPSPVEAIRRGAGMVHQHFMLVDTLTVAENVVLGAEPVRRWPWWPRLVDRRRAEAEVGELAARHGLVAAPGRRVGELSVGEQQRVEILKVLYRGARLLILDEPTAVLTPPEVEELFVVLRALVAAGGTVVLVTHKLDEVMAISSEVTVLRRGEVAARLRTAETTASEIARAMVGGDPGGPPPPATREAGEVLLAVEGVDAGGGSPVNRIEQVSFTVRAGEIVGVAGVEGNGQTALIEAVTGLLPGRGHVRSGRILFAGHDITRASPAARRRLGMAHVPEDRHRRGLLLDLSVADNLLLGRESVYARGGWPGAIDRRRLVRDARALCARHDVRPADPHLPARALSGGNQQKLVLARELATSPRLLVAAQPTRGVDLGAVARIHVELARLRQDGQGVLLVSAELDELLALADRILVLHRGRIVATVARGEATRALLGPLMTGAAARSPGALG